MPGVPWGVEFSKFFKFFFFKIPKMHKIDPKRIQTCFDCNLGQFFRKIFAQFSMEGRVFENFQKTQKSFKFPKTPKSFPKVSKRVLNKFWGKLFEKILPSFPWNVESSKILKKIKKIAKFQKCPISFPKVSKRVLNLFWVKFFEKFFCPEFRGQSSFRKFSKKKFQNSKNAQKCSQRYPNVF